MDAGEAMPKNDRAAMLERHRADEASLGQCLMTGIKREHRERVEGGADAAAQRGFQHRDHVTLDQRRRRGVRFGASRAGIEEVGPDAGNAVSRRRPVVGRPSGPEH